MNYSTLIFDLDGTLTNPLTGIERCMNFALVSFGHQPRSREDISARVGPPLEESVAYFTDSEDEEHVRAVVERYRERYGEFGYAENEVYPGIHESLSKLREAGMDMGVCTSKLQKYAVKVLREFELLQYFRFVSGPEYGVKKAQQLAELLQRGDIDGNALMIGDRAVDLTAAHSNGLHSAGVLWGFGSEAELSAEAPAHLFQRPEDWLRFT